MMTYSFYAGVVEVQVAVIEGGAYRSQLFSDVGSVLMIVLAFLGAFLIAIGMTEKDGKKQASP